MCVCGLKKIKVLFLALCKAGLAPPSPSCSADRSLAGPGPIPVNVQDMVHPQVAAKSRGEEPSPAAHRALQELCCVACPALLGIGLKNPLKSFW